MIELKGEYNTTKIFTDVIDDASREQIIDLLNNENYKDSKIRFMPDVHSGKGCVIGTTMTIKNKINPELVGVDIGCGVTTHKFKLNNLDLSVLDDIIRNNIPYGFNVNNHNYDVAYLSQGLIDKLICKNELKNVNRLNNSLKSLGGGNHFAELGKDNEEDNCYYLTVHTGSRNLGLQVCGYYTKLSKRTEKFIDPDIQRRALIRYLKEQGKQSLIQEELEKFNKEIIETESANILVGNSFDDYIHDIKIVQEWAKLNRMLIIQTILQKIGVDKTIETIESIHNYIDTDNMIVRKGAISANKGQRVVIPLNMRDGIVIGTGKGNEDWNYSAPHGAGRLMSRIKAKNSISLEDYKESMKDVYSTCINKNTIDESPFAYKDKMDIINNIKDTVDIERIVKPIYSFKAD